MEGKKYRKDKVCFFLEKRIFLEYLFCPSQNHISKTEGITLEKKEK